MSDQVVGVVGLGLLGRGIVTCLLANGFETIGFSRRETTRAAARAHIAEAIEEMIERGEATREQVGDWEARYADTDSLDTFGRCDFVIESIIEDYDAKQAAFDQLEDVLGEDAVIASNTSALPISILQRSRRHPARFVGMHWGEPAHILRFLEIIRGEKTGDDAFDRTADLAYRLGKEPSLVQKDIRGFVTNRMMYAMLREAFHLLESGVADVETIDRSFRNDMGWWATIAGPFRFLDLTGLEAYAAVMEELFPELSDQKTVPRTLREMVDRGAKGVANRDGFYAYTDEQAERWMKTWHDFTWDISKLAEKYVPARPADGA